MMMSVIKTIVVAILLFSFILFVSLFGSQPIFRKTPISFLNRLIRHYIPRLLRKCDQVITGGRVSGYTLGLFNYLFYENHPVVLIFFVSLQVGGEILMVPPVLPTISNRIHYLTIPLAIALPYVFLYLAATTSSAISIPPGLLRDSQISQEEAAGAGAGASARAAPPTDLDFGPRHRRAMLAYPYDYLLFHPGYFCMTCRVPKPARSKHCSLCKACIQKADHHCIWISNCVGRNNYVWFVALVTSVTVMLGYGVCLGYGFVDAMLQDKLGVRGDSVGRHWSAGRSWGQVFDAYVLALVLCPRVAGTTMLCIMCWPLAIGFVVYHGYLIWAGMTTNESGKWAEWKEDIAAGEVWRARLDVVRRGEVSDGDAGDQAAESESGGDDDDGESNEDYNGTVSDTGTGWLPREIEPRPWDDEVNWPPRGPPGSVWARQRQQLMARARPKWWYVQMAGGAGHEPVRKDEQGREVVDDRWERVYSLSDDQVVNVYDLGTWANVLDVVWNRD